MVSCYNPENSAFWRFFQLHHTLNSKRRFCVSAKEWYRTWLLRLPRGHFPGVETAWGNSGLGFDWGGVQRVHTTRPPTTTIISTWQNHGFVKIVHVTFLTLCYKDQWFESWWMILPLATETHTQWWAKLSMILEETVWDAAAYLDPGVLAIHVTLIWFQLKYGNTPSILVRSTLIAVTRATAKQALAISRKAESPSEGEDDGYTTIEILPEWSSLCAGCHFVLFPYQRSSDAL